MAATQTVLLYGWSTNLRTVLSMSLCPLLFQNLMFPLSRSLPFIFDYLFIFCSTQPLRGYNHQHKSDSVKAYSSCVGVIVFLFSSLAVPILVGVGCLVLVSLVVLCLCRRVFSHGFDFLPSSWPNSISNVLTSLLHTSSTHHGPPLWNLSPQTSTPTPIKSCGDYDFSLLHKRCCPHTSSLWLLFPTHLLYLLPPLPSPPSPSWIFFWTQPPALRPFIPVCGLSHVALLTLFVLSAAKRERPEQNARLLLAASTSPSGPPSAPPYARL